MHLSFPETHKVGIIGSFVFPYVCSFLFYLHIMVLVNVKLDFSGHLLV